MLSATKKWVSLPFWSPGACVVFQLLSKVTRFAVRPVCLITCLVRAMFRDAVEGRLPTVSSVYSEKQLRSHPSCVKPLENYPSRMAGK